MVNLSGQPTFLKLDILGKCCSLEKKIGEKRAKKSRRDIPGQTWKFRDFFHRLNPGIFYPGIFQESKSRDFLVPGFFDPGISRDIPGPGYPVDIPTYGEHAGRCFWCDCSKEVLARSICLFSKKKIEERQPVDMEGQVKFAVLSITIDKCIGLII